MRNATLSRNKYYLDLDNLKISRESLEAEHDLWLWLKELEKANRRWQEAPQRISRAQSSKAAGCTQIRIPLCSS